MLHRILDRAQHLRRAAAEVPRRNLRVELLVLGQGGTFLAQTSVVALLDGQPEPPARRVLPPARSHYPTAPFACFLSAVLLCSTFVMVLAYVLAGWRPLPLASDD